MVCFTHFVTWDTKLNFANIHVFFALREGTGNLEIETPPRLPRPEQYAVSLIYLAAGEASGLGEAPSAGASGVPSGAGGVLPQAAITDTVPIAKKS